MLFAKAELCLPKNIIHQGINPTVQNTLNTFEVFGKSEMVLWLLGNIRSLRILGFFIIFAHFHRLEK